MGLGCSESSRRFRTDGIDDNSKEREQAVKLKYLHDLCGFITLLHRMDKLPSDCYLKDTKRHGLISACMFVCYRACS